jgi:hypothetical protein
MSQFLLIFNFCVFGEILIVLEFVFKLFDGSLLFFLEDKVTNKLPGLILNLFSELKFIDDNGSSFLIFFHCKSVTDDDNHHRHDKSAPDGNNQDDDSPNRSVWEVISIANSGNGHENEPERVEKIVAHSWWSLSQESRPSFNQINLKREYH